MSYFHVVLPRNFLLMISQPMTGTAHEDGSELDGRVLKFPSSSPNDLGVTVYDPLGGVPVAELEVIKEGKLRHG